MPEKGIRSTYSQCPLQLLICDDTGSLSTGTACYFFAADGAEFLITNWHIVSGKNPFDQKYLRKDQRVPIILKARIATWVGDPEHRSFTTVAVEVPLYNEDRSIPNWYEHPELGNSCDVVAIPFQKPSTTPSFMHVSANRVSMSKIPVKPGIPVFVIGFPSSLSVGFGLPIWKSGYIASEPYYDIAWGGEVSDLGGMLGGKKIPAFLIDSLTREGMSGSPVFASYAGSWDMSDPYRPVDPDEPGFWTRNDIALWGNQMQFVGLYSGRVPSREAEAAFGFCWRIDAIEAICAYKKIGRHPHN